MPTFKRFEEIFTKANMTERQINALIGYLVRSKRSAKVKESLPPYVLDLPDDLA